ncbi:hypothetical protein [Levilactobacillus spicheri]|jgi:hypothetical protein|uniref:Uncharacterized protein n=1 Tax=Levilactobacillus spicheri TaxID=216463 RepID=A0A0F3RXY5_9LACO|nr:hypothetical protein [Levilactobacillus spicheri]KJW13677.1 hypothetical protein VC81_01930 [Levilactobacillus spicheri]GEO66809.1 hypothetical protein LSP04_12280 [Levilactobacillus spicheri]
MKRLVPIVVTAVIAGFVTLDSYRTFTQNRLTNQTHQATENVATSRAKSEKVVVRNSTPTTTPVTTSHR